MMIGSSDEHHLPLCPFLLLFPRQHIPRFLEGDKRINAMLRRLWFWFDWYRSRSIFGACFMQLHASSIWQGHIMKKAFRPKSNLLSFVFAHPRYFPMLL